MNNVEGYRTKQISSLPDGLAEKMLSERIENAKKVIEDCRTEKYFYASKQNYRETWLRDLVYSEDLLLSGRNKNVFQTSFRTLLTMLRPHALGHMHALNV